MDWWGCSPVADDLQAVLRKVQALIAKADRTDNKHEADAYRTKADALMFKYRIEESTLPTPEQKASLKPIYRLMNLCSLRSMNDRVYYTLAYWSLKHVDAMFVQGPYVDVDGERMMTLDVCGYESDLAYAELLFTSFSLAFGARMEVKADKNLTDQENAYRLRMAGHDGGRVSEMLWGVNNKANRGLARRLFTAESMKRGEDPTSMLGLGNNMDTFRESYKEGFAERARQRLRMMRTDTGGVGLVLASRKSEVEDMFYAKHPEMDHRGQDFAVQSIGGRDTCEKCKKAASGFCRDHSHLKPRKLKTAPFSRAGYTTGQSAADAADIRHSSQGSRGLS